MPERSSTTSCRRVLLALNGASTDHLVVQLGCQLAKPHGPELVALHVVEVDWAHDLAEDLANGSEEASTILDGAEAAAERHGLALTTDLLQARDVGAAIVDEAVELGADLIILGLPYRKRFGGDFAIGRTVPYVLQSAGCEVIVVREPIADAVPGQIAGPALADGEKEEAPAPARGSRLLAAVRDRR